MVKISVTKVDEGGQIGYHVIVNGEPRHKVSSRFMDQQRSRERAIEFAWGFRDACKAFSVDYRLDLSGAWGEHG